MWTRSGFYTILTRDKCFIQMLLSHIVGEVMNSGACARPRSPGQVELGRRSKIKSNVPPTTGKVHKSGLLICMDCKNCLVPCKNKLSGEYDVSLRTK